MNGDRNGHPADCPRTRGLIDRIVKGSAGDEDHRHAATCPACGRVMARAARFDSELARSAQRLIAEDMPQGMLDPSLSRIEVVSKLRLAPSALAGVAALAFVVIASVMNVRPNLLPAASATQLPLGIEAPGPTGFAASPLSHINDLTTALANTLDYDCTLAAGPTTPGPGASGGTATCTAPPDAGPFTLLVVLDAAESGSVVHVTITADILGTSTPKSRDAVATALARVIAESFTAQGPGVRAANFVFVKASELAGPAWALGIDEGGVRVDVERPADSGYIVNLAVTS